MALALRCAPFGQRPVVDFCCFLRLVSPSTSNAQHIHQSAFTCNKLIDYDEQLQNAYKVLNLDEGASIEQLKDRFVALAKQYHPDMSKNLDGSAEKFREVRDAYHFIVRHTQQEEKQSELNGFYEDVVSGIRHTAPQHRQYLEYEGVGVGNPFHRQKQYQQHRAAKASENTYEYLVDKRKKQLEEELKMDNKSLPDAKREHFYSVKKKKTTNAIERLVEDMILQSMKQGDFDNLKGMGRPLKKEEVNPYIDDMEYKLNKVLINNGFAPPWVMKEVELRAAICELRNEIRYEYARYILCKENDFKEQISVKDAEQRWNLTIERMEHSIANINKQIRDYNLIAPSLNCHFFNLSPKTELNNAIAEVTADGRDKGSRWFERAYSSLSTLKSEMHSENESLLSQFIKGFIALKNL
ncbi:DnaJ -like protein subfamily C member 28 [Toxocara canis]|uniref:DnaJ-like protein subfamily C member 28 n=2 Tax=Toxocara canis TaxID=6265 RepID=A0A0B2UZK7_TOXCA|nr:DnaJ -like protein subfamily C member 28 [Toxocara canis]VDM48175.1 unnamed protein product [Toxocara canis]